MAYPGFKAEKDFSISLHLLSGIVFISSCVCKHLPAGTALDEAFPGVSALYLINQEPGNRISVPVCHSQKPFILLTQFPRRGNPRLWSVFEDQDVFRSGGAGPCTGRAVHRVNGILMAAPCWVRQGVFRGLRSYTRTSVPCW